MMVDFGRKVKHGLPRTLGYSYVLATAVTLTAIVNYGNSDIGFYFHTEHLEPPSRPYFALFRWRSSNFKPYFHPFPDGDAPEKVSSLLKRSCEHAVDGIVLALTG